MKIHPPLKDIIWKNHPHGDVLQWFGENTHLYKTNIGTTGHPGIDLYKPEGTNILGTQGTVIDVNDNPMGYGKHVRILTDPDAEGNQLLVTYGHGKNQCVKIGDRVQDGQKIAEVSNTGVVISGGNIYWGNAPANRGVHLHLNIHKCVTPGKDGRFIAHWVSGHNVSYDNYNNGFQGSVDPLDYLDVPEEAQKINLLTKMVELYKFLIKKWQSLKNIGSG